ncbi:MAG: 5-formyltetrahydrofolate cyclo-ligase [Crocinitomix sp.]|nr:5-formyltetrahydrofolate cyclo-ligase [Crocinitomix sp.]
MTKKEVREKYKQLRKALSANELAEQSLAIFELTKSGFELEGKNISVFLPIERFLEINTWHFLRKIKADFYLPVIKGADELVHIKYENPSQIETTSWGIPEPTYGETIAPKELDLVLVPLLAIDKKGYRVGYGKGFYDQFLANCTENCQFIGLSYFDPIEKIDDLHEADIPLHFCVTPEGIEAF